MGRLMSHISLDKAQAAKRTALRQFEKLGKVTAVGITIVSTAKNKKEAEAFYRYLGVPLKTEEQK